MDWRAAFLQDGQGHSRKGQPQAASDGAEMVLALGEENKKGERDREGNEQWWGTQMPGSPHLIFTTAMWAAVTIFI